MVGGEPLWHHQHTLGVAVLGQGPKLLEDIWARPRFGSASCGLPAQRPPGSVQPGRPSDRGGRGGQPFDVGIAVQHTKRQRVSGHQHLGVRRHRSQAGAELTRHEISIGVQRPPGVDGGVADAGGCARRTRPIVVLPHRRRRIVRGQNQPDDVAHPDVQQMRHAVLDKRRRVLLPQGGRPPTGLILLQRQGDRPHLICGATTQRGGAPKRLVSAPQIGQRLLGRRPTTTDVGVILLDLIW